jgi:type I restriction enzyme, R subunit
MEQRYFTAGEIVVVGRIAHREKAKRFDYLLRYRNDFPLAIVEAKVKYKSASDGLQQAKEYAEILGLTFCYSTNGTDIIEYDFSTGLTKRVSKYPTPQELYERLKQSGTTYITEVESENAISQQEVKIVATSKQPLSENTYKNDILTKPLFYNSEKPIIPNDPQKPIRYYQLIAVNKAVYAVLEQRQRILLTLATGTGKTAIAAQIAYKLWNNNWNRAGVKLKPKILYISDRTLLVSEPMNKDFSIFGNAVILLSSETFATSSTSRDVYFSTYQSLASMDKEGKFLFEKFDKDFFDLVIIDECHRGSAADDSQWRDILNHFTSAFQLGLTATPLRDDTRDTYNYFGNPIYIYSLKQGLKDGFLAPYIVHRVTTNIDAQEFRPQANQYDRYGRLIPDKSYTTPNFEREISIIPRTTVVAGHLTKYMKRTGRYAKTIVFCEDQAHASDFVEAFANHNADKMKENKNYVVRITSDEGDIGREFLSKFIDVDSKYPVVVVTSRLLSTGVDVPTCANIAIFRIVGSMAEFKQIVGRGTRTREDKGKLFFTMLDYTGSAFNKFSDPEFDGDPPLIIDEGGEEEPTGGETEGGESPTPPPTPPKPPRPPLPPRPPRLTVDDCEVHIAIESVHILDKDGKLRTISFTEYAKEQVVKLFPDPKLLREKWFDKLQREMALEALIENGIDLDMLREVTKMPDAEPFDLLCYVAYGMQPKTRKERAALLRQNGKDFFEKYPEKARWVLSAILDKYIEYGADEFSELPKLLKIKPISDFGTINEIAAVFGSPVNLRSAVTELYELLYAA